MAEFKGKIKTFEMCEICNNERIERQCYKCGKWVCRLHYTELAFYPKVISICEVCKNG